ncbi:hypothetical protein D8S82_14385 [Mycobacterium hodleri]|uniref:Uncharacterized protein n=1 Tax=Mycolicibacterium hodleri TaxID=49897 RepID=A0A544W180_9MYCO|nr:hypothetical protein [Mycolicibacterium hodleri]TQR85963.1 hypothetical protein D8S82_14385 [Mycolicibacterium hodleri]
MPNSGIHLRRDLSRHRLFHLVGHRRLSVIHAHRAAHAQLLLLAKQARQRTGTHDSAHAAADRIRDDLFHRTRNVELAGRLAHSIGDFDVLVVLGRDDSSESVNHPGAGVLDMCKPDVFSESVPAPDLCNDLAGLCCDPVILGAL